MMNGSEPEYTANPVSLVNACLIIYSLSAYIFNDEHGVLLPDRLHAD